MTKDLFFSSLLEREGGALLALCLFAKGDRGGFEKSKIAVHFINF